MGPLPPSTDDRAMWDVWQSQFTLPAVTVADELGLFERLGDAAMDGGALARELAVDERALGLLLAALAAQDLVEKRGGLWAASASARTWLHPRAEGYWGPFLYRFRETIPLHAVLLACMKTGKRPETRYTGVAEWEKGAMDPEIARQIANFMHAHSLAPAAAVAAQPDFAAIGSVLDVGCGSGVYGMAMAQAHPAMQVGLMDLAEMVAEAGKRVAAAGLADRIDLIACNMFTQDWPQGYQAHFFANVFHDWSEETNALIAAKSFAALPPGGRIFLSEILMDDALDGPWQAASFSLMMLTGTLGKQYSLPEFAAILEGAGFEDVRACRSGGGYYSLVSAKKPG
ncbi:MAG: methyltransferase domain-containing protein [Erythrobacter sp.]|nr:methyltransferase domain-containing protein [Erythrobacter sp.]